MDHGKNCELQLDTRATFGFLNSEKSGDRITDTQKVQKVCAFLTSPKTTPPSVTPVSRHAPSLVVHTKNMNSRAFSALAMASSTVFTMAF